MVNKNSDFKYFIFPNVSNAYLKLLIIEHKPDFDNT